MNEIKEDEKAAFNNLYQIYIHASKRRKLIFRLSKNEFYKLIKSKCFYCKIKPLQIFKAGKRRLIYNGIDRVDNSKGYIKSNCVSCCKYCNFLKGRKNKDEFLEQLKFTKNPMKYLEKILPKMLRKIDSINMETQIQPKKNTSKYKKLNKELGIITIIRYKNRKLYNTDSSKYVNLVDIYKLNNENVKFRVLCDKTKKDVTNYVIKTIEYHKALNKL
jgi:hypothetical protein